MKPIALFALPAALLCAAPAYAEIPPQHQRLVELKAILDHDDMATAFPGMELVQRVEFVKYNLYRVSTESCSLYARIVIKPLPRGMVGTRQFDVALGKPTCPRD